MSRLKGLLVGHNPELKGSRGALMGTRRAATGFKGAHGAKKGVKDPQLKG
jgi:hypothetical protein